MRPQHAATIGTLLLLLVISGFWSLPGPLPFMPGYARLSAQLPVSVPSPITIGNPSHAADGATWAAGSTLGVLFTCVRDDAAPTVGGSVTDGKIGGCRMGPYGNVYFSYVDPATGLFPTFATDATVGQAVKTSGPQGILGGVAFGAAPSAVAAGQAARWMSTTTGVAFTLGGAPNVVTAEAQIQDADGAQTDAALVTCGAGCRIVVTRVYAWCDAATTAGTLIVVGFGAATLPSRAHTGVTGILLAGDGAAPGGGVHSGDGSGIVGTGGDGEDLRVTTEDPVGGSCSVGYTYFTIAA